MCHPYVCAFLLWLPVILRKIVVREEQKSLHDGKIPLDGMREWDPWDERVGSTYCMAEAEGRM